MAPTAQAISSPALTPSSFDYFPTTSPQPSETVPDVPDEEVLVSSLRLYGVIFLVNMMLFSILKKHYPRAFNVRSWAPGLSSELSQRTHGYVDWLWTLFRISDDEIRRDCGLDALTYLRALRFGTRVAMVGTFNAIFLMTVYATGSENSDDRIVQVTIANVKPGSMRFLATVVASYIFFGNCMWLLLKEYAWFIGQRHAFLQERKPRNYTVYVSGIPSSYRSNHSMKRFFEKVFSKGSVLEARVAVRANELTKKARARAALVDKLAIAIDKKNETGVRPTHKKGRYLKGEPVQQVDSIDTWSDELDALNTEIADMIREVEKAMRPNLLLAGYGDTGTETERGQGWSTNKAKRTGSRTRNGVGGYGKATRNLLADDSHANDSFGSFGEFDNTNEYTGERSVTELDGIEEKRGEEGDDDDDNTNNNSNNNNNTNKNEGSMSSLGGSTGSLEASASKLDTSNSSILTRRKFKILNHNVSQESLGKGVSSIRSTSRTVAQKGQELAKNTARAALQEGKAKATDTVRSAATVATKALLTAKDVASTAIGVQFGGGAELLDAGFVTFRKISQNHAALQLIHHPVPYKMHVWDAPDPSDVLWGNVGKNHRSLMVGKLLSMGLTGTLCFFWTLPVTAINQLTNVESLRNEFPTLNEWFDAAPILEGSVAILAPILILLLTFVLLPKILERISRLEGPIAVSALEVSVFLKMALFMVVQTFFVSTISGTIASLSTDFDLDEVARRIPEQSTYFMQIIVVRATVVGLSLELLRVVPFLQAFLRGCVGPRSTARERYKPFLGLRPLSNPYKIRYGTVFGADVLLFVVLFVYSSAAPLVNFFLGFVFFLMGSGYRYQFMHNYPKDPDSGGILFVAFVQVIQTCMTVAQVTTLLYLLLKRAYGAVPFMVPLIVTTLLFNLYLRQEHSRVATFLTSADCQHQDLEDEELASDIGEEADFRNQYVQPELRHKVLYPDNFDDRFGTTSTKQGQGIDGQNVASAGGGDDDAEESGKTSMEWTETTQVTTVGYASFEPIPEARSDFLEDEEAGISKEQNDDSIEVVAA